LLRKLNKKGNVKEACEGHVKKMAWGKMVKVKPTEDEDWVEVSYLFICIVSFPLIFVA
jgi:hypothetical protein